MQSFGDLSWSTSFDERRARIFKNNLCLLLDKKEALAYQELQMNMLSVSPDDLPVAGNLLDYPNIFLNVGHGQRMSSTAFLTSKLVSDSITGHSPSDPLVNKLHPRRFLV